MEEIWKDVKGLEGTHQVSNLSRVRSVDYYKADKNGVIKHHCGRILDGHINNKGYVVFSIFGKQYKRYRMVAEAFIPNPDNKPCVDHINTIRTDDRIENLRWATYKENSNNSSTLVNMSNAHIGHSVSNITRNKMSVAKKGKPRSSSVWNKGLKMENDVKDKISASLVGNKNKPKRSVCQYDKQMNPICTYESVTDAIKQTGLKGIPNCLTGLSKSSGGFIWKYSLCSRAILLRY